MSYVRVECSLIPAVCVCGWHHSLHCRILGLYHYTHMYVVSLITSLTHPQLVYRKDREEALKGFTPVAETVSSRQASQASRLASNIGYSMAPHAQERAPHQPQPYNRE